MNQNVACALIRIRTHDRGEERQIEDGELAAAFARQIKAIKALAVDSISPVSFLHIRLLLVPNLRNAFITRLSVDIISWHTLSADLCLPPILKGERQIDISESLHLCIYVGRFDHAIALGQAVRREEKQGCIFTIRLTASA
jgi:hypothetical protein